MHWLRRFACRLAIKSAPAMPFPEMSPSTSVVECSQWREGLGKEPCLHLFGDFQFVSSTAFGFQFLRGGAPLCFDRLGHFVEADQGEGIPVDIFEAGEDSAPNRRLLPPQRWSISTPVISRPVISRPVISRPVVSRAVVSRAVYRLLVLDAP